jgi:hypothetical protein
LGQDLDVSETLARLHAGAAILAAAPTSPGFFVVPDWYQGTIRFLVISGDTKEPPPGYPVAGPGEGRDGDAGPSPCCHSGEGAGRRFPSLTSTTRTEEPEFCGRGRAGPCATSLTPDPANSVILREAPRRTMRIPLLPVRRPKNLVDGRSRPVGHDPCARNRARQAAPLPNQILRSALLLPREMKDHAGASLRMTAILPCGAFRIRYQIFGSRCLHHSITPSLQLHHPITPLRVRCGGCGSRRARGPAPAPAPRWSGAGRARRRAR